MATEKRLIGALKQEGMKLVGRVVTASLGNTYVIIDETDTGVSLRRLGSREEVVEERDETHYEYMDDVSVLVLDRDVSRLNHPMRWKYLAERYPQINQPFS